jgi:two-component system NarL family sensor kinase
MLHDVEPEALAEALRARQERVLVDGRLLDEEEVLPSREGPRTYLSHRFLLTDAAGRDNAVCAVLTDISERKRAEDDLRSLAAQLSAAEDDQRRTIARALHESVGQTLTALKMELLRSPLPGENGATPLALVEQLIAETRTMTFDLYPTMLDDLGLLPTLESFAERFTARSGVRAAVRSVGEPVPLPGTAAKYLFRATRELLHNVAKHAGATEVLIAVHWRPRSIRISVSDDGAGFEPAEALDPERRRGLGLADIRERVRFLGGQLLVDSAGGRGSQIVLELPLAGEPHA